MRYLIALLIYLLLPAQVLAAAYCGTVGYCPMNAQVGQICNANIYGTTGDYLGGATFTIGSKISGPNTGTIQWKDFPWQQAGGSVYVYTGASGNYNVFNATFKTSGSCTVPCTSWTYSAWSECASNSTQTRTITSSSPATCTGGTPEPLTQSCTYVPPVPAHCSDGTFNLGEAGQDCGGGDCPYPCETWCPFGYAATDNVMCEAYRYQDSSGNCPVPPTVNGDAIVYSKTADGRCRYLTTGALGRSAADGGTSPPYPQPTELTSYAPGSSTTSEATTTTVAGDVTTGTGTYELNGSTGSQTTTTTVTGGVTTTTQETTLEVPQEANWSNYNFAGDPADNDTSQLSNTMWGERPDWSEATADVPLAGALSGSDVVLVNPSPVLIDTNVSIFGTRSMHLYVTLARFEGLFEIMGTLFVAMSYIWGLLLLCNADRGE